ncbi:hypothetical protein [Salipiger mucosus]|uniref:Uncharacterized protein n=1 Tax=Salipiger mucosus DSM 16094 TaxID=1123237 RepID=S9Q957_9RHOB|nr:hypothetical protein [Salipiger mucosus]EPX77921.1 hypothetical protein Salmuc_03243 [Salipiger mucosus DSM 16094]
MTDPVALYGTAVPPAPSTELRYGEVTMTLQEGALRHVCVGSTEIIRSVAFLARDRDWGTIAPELGALEQHEDDGALRLGLPMRFDTGTAQLDVMLQIRIADGRLSVEAEGRAYGDFETNRTGFTVLHPIKGVAGCPARVIHSDGRTDYSRFPDLIEPWQPFMDISALEHEASGMRVRCAFTGDTFEMEDQRQWGDASYKIYNRPLALPWPYVIADGAALAQSCDVTWQPAPATPTAPPASERQSARIPETALVLTADDAQRLAQRPADLDVVRPHRLLCHVDAAEGPVEPQIAAFTEAQAVLPGILFDLELICRFDGCQPPGEELDAHAAAVRDSGFVPASVFVCPSVDRQSTPPGSAWPDCPPLEEIHAAAARAFPDLPRGGGMASLFTELNRKRPPVRQLDFVSHALCPIVHAADDGHVMETLETIPHIARSARAIIGGCDYRIGPATIAMRQNPYGSRTIPNPDCGRVCMTDDDPRHRGAFGAAFALGLATALVPFDIAVWTPAALYGPRGLFGDDGPLPIAGVLRALSDLAGETVRDAAVAEGMASLTTDKGRLAANLTPSPNGGLPPYGWQFSDGVEIERPDGKD